MLDCQQGTGRTLRLVEEMICDAAASSQPMVPAPVVLYFACSGVGVVAGVAATIVGLLH